MATKMTARAGKIAPFYVMELLEKARQMEAEGEEIVHLEIGEPDFPTPTVVREAAIRAINEGLTFYTQSLGLPALREKLADYYWKHHGVAVSPERIVITSGTSGAFFLLCEVCLQRGMNLVLSDPGYPCYRNFGLLADARILALPVGEEANFELTARDIEALDAKPHVVLISSPSNPTGSVYSPASLEGVARAVAGRRGLLIVDEIYSGLTYGEAPRTALELSDDIVVVNGFSKTFAMTGWRLGWMIVPPSLIRPIQKVAQNVFISPPTVSQHAAIAALDAVEEVESMRRVYEERRDFLVPRLREIGFRVPVVPKGAFYVYADIAGWGLGSMQFVERALREARVAVTPGHDFGRFEADTHARFSYANNLEQLAEGCRRLESWVREL